MKNSVSYLRSVATVVAFIVMFVSLSSCGDDNPGDYRDSFIGTYTGECVFTNSGVVYREAVTVTVTKSSVSSDRIVVSSTFYNYNVETFEAAVTKDGNFVGSFNSNIDGYSTSVEIRNGRFRGIDLTYEYQAQTYVLCTVTVRKL